MFGGNLKPTKNNTDWIVSGKFRKKSDGSLLDLTGIEFSMAVYRDECGTVLSGSTSGGQITSPDTGIITWQFLASEMSSLKSGTYTVDLIARRDIFTSPIGKFSVAVVDGRA